MYWLRGAKLTEDLREGRVDQKEQFKYCLATFVVWNVIAQVFFYFGGPYFPIRRLIPVGLNLAVTIMGIVYCYAVNKMGDNKDFILRLFCLGWPIGMQILTHSLFLGLTMIGITVLFPSEERSALVAIGWMLRWLLFMAILHYFTSISIRLKQVAGAEKMPGIGEAFHITFGAPRK